MIVRWLLICGLCLGANIAQATVCDEAINSGSNYSSAITELAQGYVLLEKMRTDGTASSANLNIFTRELKKKKEILQKQVGDEFEALLNAELKKQGHLSADEKSASRVARQEKLKDQRLALAQWEQIVEFKDHTSLIQALVFTADGEHVVTGDDSGQIIVWNMKTGKQVKAYHHGGGIISLYLSLDGRYIVSAGYVRDQKVRVWETFTGKPIQTFDGHNNVVDNVEFSPDGKYIASFDWDNMGIIWDLKSGEELGRFKIVPAFFKFTADGKSILFIAEAKNGYSLLKSNFSGTETLVLKQSGYNSLEYSPDKQFIAIGKKGYAAIIDAQTYAEIHILFKKNKSKVAFRRFHFSLDGRYLGILENKKYGLSIWDVKTGKPVSKFNVDGKKIHDFRFNSDGRYILMTGVDPMSLSDTNNRVFLGDAETGAILETIHTGISRIASEFGKDDSSITVGVDNKIHVYSPYTIEDED